MGAPPPTGTTVTVTVSENDVAYPFEGRYVPLTVFEDPTLKPEPILKLATASPVEVSTSEINNVLNGTFPLLNTVMT